MNDNNFSIKRLLVIIIMMTIVVAGGTFAWFTYQSKESALVLTIGEIDDTQIVLKPYQVTGTMTPVTTYTSGVYSTVEVSNNGESSSSINLFYKINELDEELIDNGLKYTIVSSATQNGTYTEVKTGDFTAFKGQSEALIYETEVKDKLYYKVYLWVDSSAGDQSAIQGSTLNVELNGSILQDATPPELVEGMIPVTISNTGVVTTISSTDENWYDYGHKKWANIVLVDADSRSSYEGTTGKTVTQSDILAYYVWIPRYKYKLWTTDATETTNPQTINIIFEDKDAPMMLEKTKSLYRTHPAFWWDGNNDGKVDEGETLAGIWVGKFETTGDATTPTILPNTSSLRSQNVSTQFTTSLKFSNGSFNGTTGAVIFSDASNGYSQTGTTYGLGINADSHMMKNSEWGAAAYLSHSQYGINSEVRLNNNSNYTTGCGASEENGTESTSCQIAYAGVSSGSYPQSTTGNITGIFDMSGGAFEYVMGVYSDSNGKPMSGFDSSSNSGFNGLLRDGSTYSNGILFPQSKYYNLYLSNQFTGNTSTNMSLCTLETCGGHALFETKAWYGDYAEFIDSGDPWFLRSGHFLGKTNTGMFDTHYRDGDDLINWFSWRSVIITLPKYTVSYNANGGSGVPSNQTKVYGVDMNISNTAPTKTNVTFQGWGTSSDSKKVVYNPGGIYTNNSAGTLYAIWKDTNAPIATISLTNNVSASQTATLTCTDAVGVTEYYFGTNELPTDSDFTSITSTTNMSVTKTVSDSGTYYLYCRDADKNISDGVNVETYKTTLTYTTTSTTTSNVITEKGKSFTYSPTLTNYTFLGWYTASDFSGTKITTYTPSGNTTLYGKTLENTLSGNVTISGNVTYGETLTANPNITADANTQNAGEAASYSYQWYSNSTNSTSGGSAISGATSSTYTIGNGLIDKYIYVVVTATKSNYVTKTVSAVTATAVAKRNVTITANNQTVTYGTSITQETSQLTTSNLASGDSITAITLAQSKTTAGTGTITPSAATIKKSSTDVTSNYNITYNTGTLTINQKSVTVTADSNSKTYDGAALTDSGCTGNSLINGHTVTCTMTSGSTITDAGSVNNTINTYVIKDSSGNDVTSNYNVTKAVGSLVVNKASLTPSVSASNKTYDGNTTATCTITLSGIVSGDTVTGTAGSCTFANKNVGTSKMVTASSITISGTDASNYNLSTTSATTTANITVKSITPSVSASNKTYDGNATATCTLNLPGVVSGDTVNGTIGTCTFADSNAGTGKTVTAASITISGTDAGNYSLSTTSVTSTANITKATNPLTVTGKGGTYKGTALELVTVSGAQGTVYYSTSTSLTSSNYSTSGSTTIPTGSPGSSENSTTFTVYYYTSGNSNYSASSGNVSATVTRESYTVSYNMCSGTGGPSNQTKYYAMTLTLSSTIPTRTGYDFTGWATDSCDGSPVYNADDDYTANVGATLYATWELAEYTISYNANIFSTIKQTSNGVTVSYNGETSYLTLHGTPTSGLSLMKLTGQTFTEGEQYKFDLTYISGSVTINDTNSFGLEVKLDDSGSWVSTRNYVSLQYPTTGTNSVILTINEAAASEGTVLHVWTWQNSSNAVVFDNYVVKVTISKVENKILSIGNNYELPATPTRTGYTFNGWNTQADGTGETITSTTVMNTAENHTLYAQWTEHKVNVYYNTNGGTITASTTYDDGTVYNWTTETDGTIKRNGTVLIQGIKYSAKTDLNNYNYSKYINITRTGYSAPSGEEWICLSGCTEEGKKFNQATSYSANDICDVTSGNCNVELGVNWKINTYTISYDANGGTGAPSSQTKTYGVTLTLSSTKPTRTNYTFLGWSTSSSATSATYAAGASYTTNAAAKLYAVWKANDTTKPACTISLTKGSTTITATYSDAVGVTGYYTGTTAPSSSTSYTAMTSSASGSKTQTASAEKTYYFAFKDAAGNIGTCSATVTGTTTEQYCPHYGNIGNCYSSSYAATCKTTWRCVEANEGLYSNYSCTAPPAPTGCTKTTSDTYSCPNGGSVSGTTCYVWENTATTYTCGSSYTKLSNRFCAKKN